MTLLDSGWTENRRLPTGHSISPWRMARREKAYAREAVGLRSK